MLGEILRIAFNRGGMAKANGKIGDLLNKKVGMCVVSMSGKSDQPDDEWITVGRIPNNSFALRIFFWATGDNGLSVGGSVGPDFSLAFGAEENSGANWQVANFNALTAPWGELDADFHNFAGPMQGLITDGTVKIKKSGDAFDAAGTCKGWFFIEYICLDETDNLEE